eukprot:9501933-Pyramimonas_sp.AAC.1
MVLHSEPRRQTHLRNHLVEFIAGDVATDYGYKSCFLTKIELPPLVPKVPQGPNESGESAMGGDSGSSSD